METLLVLWLIATVLGLIGVVGAWVRLGALSGRLADAERRTKASERQTLRLLDAMAGRVARLEHAWPAGGGAAVAQPPPQQQAAPAAHKPDAPATPEQPDAGTDAAERTAATPAKEPEPNTSLAAFRRAKDAARRQHDAEASEPSPADAADTADETTSPPESEPKPKPEPKPEPARPEPVSTLKPQAEPVPRAAISAPTTPATPTTPAPAPRSAPKPTLPQAARTGAPRPPKPREPRKVVLNFEQLLGGKVFVWIGAIALVLTGAFLLKYGFDHDIITEPMRVLAAGGFGLALLGVAEWFIGRRRVHGDDRYLTLAQAACGAGVAVLFGTVYAGHSLYGLISDWPAFALLGAVTAGAVVLSLRFGPLVALLGLVGGFALPPLLGGALPGRPGMVVYLLALELGVLAVTRKRGWLGISALTLLGSVGWSLGYAVTGGTDADRAFTALLVMATAAVFVLNSAWTHGKEEDTEVGTFARSLWLALGAVGSAVALLALVVVRNNYSGQDLVMLGLMSAGTLVLARADARYTVLGWVSMGLGAVLLLGSGWAQWWSRGEDVSVLLGGALAFGLLFGVGGYAAQWWPTRRAGFAAMSALAGPVFLLTAIVGGGWLLGFRGDVFGAASGAGGGFSGGSASWGWWAWSLGAAAVYALAAGPLVRRGRLPGAVVGRRVDGLGDGWPASAYGLSSVGLAALAALLVLDHPWLAIAWAALGMGAGVIGWRCRLPVLTRASGALSGMSAVLLLLPGPFWIEPGGAVVLNQMLVTYALAALCFGVAGYSAHRAGHASIARQVQALAVGALAVGVAVLVRDGFHREAFAEPAVVLEEWPTYAVALLGLASALLVAAKWWALETVEVCAVAVGLVGVALAVFGPAVFGNPLLYDTVGWELVYSAVYLYLVPAAMVVVFAKCAQRLDNPELAGLLRPVPIVLTAVFALVQVRNGFHFTDLDAEAVDLYEWPTYVVALLGLAVGLLTVGQGVFRGWVRGSGAWCALVVGLVGVAFTLAGPVLSGNPLRYEAAGWGLVFGLAYLYLVPAGLFVLLAHQAQRLGEPALARSLRIGAVGLSALFVLLQVRNAFHFADLDAAAMGFYERATYGTALFALAWALRGAGRWLGARFMEQAAWAVAAAGTALTLFAVVVVGSPLADSSIAGGLGLAGAMGYTYLVPAVLGVLFAAGRARDAWERLIARLMRVAGVVLAVAFVVLQVRNGFQQDALRTGAVGLFEWATYGLALMLLGAALAWAGRRWVDLDLGSGGRFIALIGLGVSLLGAVLVRNPLWTPVSVGLVPVFNGLWYLYAPAIAALAVYAHRLRAAGRFPLARAAGGGAIALGFLLLCLLVRQGFSADGTLVLANAISDAERYAYSLAWVVFGVGLLAAGVVTRLDTLRFGSLAVMLIAVCKVFVVDTAGLDDLLRVFSFFGLGVTLLLLGYTYQRFVFRRPANGEVETLSTGKENDGL